MDIAQKYRLLYARAAFGLGVEEYMHPKDIESAVNDLFPKAQPLDLEMIDEREWQQNSPRAMKDIMDEGERKEKKKEFRKKTNDLNLLWVQAMTNSSFPLLEKMAMFWHGHFATHIDNPYYDQQLLNIFRKKGLGNFGELLHAVSKSSAMLLYLNSKQNKKMHPNENFAREVMELFTLGKGHYTEDDIKEAARAFTGWGFDGNGDFEFKGKQHDFGQKKFLGKTGDFTGEDVLDILLKQKQTAVFITQKIYRYFVSDEKIDQKRVAKLAEGFYESNLSIPVLLKSIFTASWFYDGSIVGSKVKSPIELLIGYQKIVPIQYGNPKTVIHIQKALGQYLFNPPNVAGWAGGKSWIDSSSLVFRMRLPEPLLGQGELEFHIKESGNDPNPSMQEMEQGGSQKKEAFKVGKTEVDWKSYLAFWGNTPKENLPQEMGKYLIGYALDESVLKEVAQFAEHDNMEHFIKNLTIRFMELPEFQLT